jgi:hypothetical protein
MCAATVELAGVVQLPELSEAHGPQIPLKSAMAVWPSDVLEPLVMIQDTTDSLNTGLEQEQSRSRLETHSGASPRDSSIHCRASVETSFVGRLGIEVADLVTISSKVPPASAVVVTRSLVMVNGSDSVTIAS